MSVICELFADQTYTGTPVSLPVIQESVELELSFENEGLDFNIRVGDITISLDNFDGSLDSMRNKDLLSYPQGVYTYNILGEDLSNVDMPVVANAEGYYYIKSMPLPDGVDAIYAIITDDPYDSPFGGFKLTEGTFYVPAGCFFKVYAGFGGVEADVPFSLFVEWLELSFYKVTIDGISKYYYGEDSSKNQSTKFYDDEFKVELNLFSVEGLVLDILSTLSFRNLVTLSETIFTSTLDRKLIRLHNYPFGDPDYAGVADSSAFWDGVADEIDYPSFTFIPLDKLIKSFLEATGFLVSTLPSTLENQAIGFWDGVRKGSDLFPLTGGLAIEKLDDNGYTPLDLVKQTLLMNESDIDFDPEAGGISFLNYAGDTESVSVLWSNRIHTKSFKLYQASDLSNLFSEPLPWRYLYEDTPTSPDAFGKKVYIISEDNGNPGIYFFRYESAEWIPGNWLTYMSLEFFDLKEQFEFGFDGFIGSLRRKITIGSETYVTIKHTYDSETQTTKAIARRLSS